MHPPARLPVAPVLGRGTQHHARTRRRTGHDDAGVATLELVVIFPVLLLLLFGVFQGTLYFHGRNVLLAAAEQGVRAARLDAQPDRAATAVQQARQFLVETGELNNLSGLTITPVVDGDQVRLTITARTVSLLPGIPGPQVSQTAAGSIERFTSRSQP